MEYSEISPNLYVGPCPKTPEDIDTLKEMGISSVLNLQTIDDERYLNIQWKALKRHYDSCGIEVHRVPVRDFDPVHLEEKLPVCVRELHDVLSASHIAYLHCTAGCGRSPTVAIAYHPDRNQDAARSMTDGNVRFLPAARRGSRDPGL
jgi:protein-tyrosine phosphatase